MKKRTIAISEILILLIAIFAFAYFISWGFGFVSAEDPVADFAESEGVDGSNSGSGNGPTLGKGIYALAASISKNPVVKTFGIATGIYAGTQFAIGFLGGDKELQEAASKGTTTGYLGYKAVLKWLPELGKGWGLGIGIGAGVIVFLLTYKSKKTKIVTFECGVWVPPTGGSNCEDCNKQGIFLCSEYQCKSLGLNCELINDRCVWINKDDKKYPIVSLFEGALKEGHKYTPDSAVSPPNRGAIVETDSGECIDPFTPMSFGLNTDENAICKFDIERKDSFDKMLFDFLREGYNHSVTLKFPGPDSINSEEPEIQNDGKYEFYARCQDYNGNENPANFVFKFCIKEGLDMSPPLILGADRNETSYVGYNQDSTDIEIYIDKPSACKWSTQDKSYDEMENIMECTESVFEMDLQATYPCSDTLTGLKNNQENKFYFRCKSYPLKEESERYTNSKSTIFNLIGTQPLVIDSVEPNGTIKGSTSTIKVDLESRTSAGANEGKALCYYGETTNYEGGLFSNTDSYQHSQKLTNLIEGDYEYHIKCVDAGGNSDTETISFNVESDTFAPIIVRIYKEDNNLKIITNDNAECVYDDKDCSYPFNDGISMRSTDNIEHFTNWNTDSIYYIKCQDEYGNQPAPDGCSIIARPTD